MKATRTRTARQSRLLPAVTGTVKVLRPVGAVGPAKNQVAAIEIASEHGTRRYFLRVTDTCYSLFGFDEAKGVVTHYDVSADCTSCDCPDFVARSQSRADGLCKHCKACRALVAKGQLPAIPVCTTAVSA